MGKFIEELELEIRATEEQYRLALEIDPNNVKLRSNYGYLLYKMGRDEDEPLQN